MIRLAFFLGCALVGLVGCDNEVPIPRDDRPPSTVAYGITPSGSRVEFVNGDLLLSTREVVVRVDADEPATVFYSTDGSEPTRRGGIARNSLGLGVSMDTTVRWFAEDFSGNAGPLGQVHIRFDRDPPEVEVVPPGGSFAGGVDVEIRTLEAVRVWWTTHGVAPVPGARDTQVGSAAPDAPLRLRLTTNTTLQVLVRDLAGNSVDLPPQIFVVDDQPPLGLVTPPEGHYIAPIEARLTSDDATARVHYTTDGSQPGPDSPTFLQPVPINLSTLLRFIAIDPGGNASDVQTINYTIGPRPDPAARIEGDGLLFPTEGGLWLAAALLESAGLLSGTAEPGFGHDWEAGQIGRTAIDSALFQSGVGIHALHSDAVIAATELPGAPVDANGNGTNLDEVYAARVDRLRATAATLAPVGIHPTAIFYLRARAEFLAAGAEVPGADGLPLSENDFNRLRWEGARGTDREVGPGTTAAGLRALAARARAGMVGTRLPGAGGLTTVERVLALRCGTCHRSDGAEPHFASVLDYQEAQLIAPGDADGSRLMTLLDDHEGDPDPRVDAVRTWINAGAAIGPGETGPRAAGAEGRDALLGMLAADTAGRALELVTADFFLDPGSRRLGGANPGTYQAARVAVTEADAGPGLPRTLERLVAQSAAFDTRGHGRLARALASLIGLAVRDQAFEIPELSGRNSAQALATELLPIVLGALLDRGRTAAGGYRALGTPGSEEGEVDALATAEAILALRAAGRLDEVGAPEVALAALIDNNGDVRAADSDFGRPQLDVQLAALHAFCVNGLTGANSALRARTLWQRLESAWWDDAAGQWQTTWGVAASAWTPDLAARVIDTLRAAHRLGIPEAQDRLQTFYSRVVLGSLLVSENWLTGEVSGGGDSDGDGIPGRAALAPDGGAPVFWPLVSR